MIHFKWAGIFILALLAALSIGVGLLWWSGPSATQYAYLQHHSNEESDIKRLLDFVASQGYEVTGATRRRVMGQEKFQAVAGTLDRHLRFWLQ